MSSLVTNMEEINAASRDGVELTQADLSIVEQSVEAVAKLVEGQLNSLTSQQSCDPGEV